MYHYQLCLFMSLEVWVYRAMIGETFQYIVLTKCGETFKVLTLSSWFTEDLVIRLSEQIEKLLCRYLHSVYSIFWCVDVCWSFWYIAVSREKSFHYLQSSCLLGEDAEGDAWRTQTQDECDWEGGRSIVRLWDNVIFCLLLRSTTFTPHSN